MDHNFFMGFTLKSYFSWNSPFQNDFESLILHIAYPNRHKGGASKDVHLANDNVHSIPHSGTFFKESLNIKG